MLWLRGALFTIVGPGVLGGLAPHLLAGGRPLRGGAWLLEWIPIVLGTAVLGACVVRFLLAGGTPAPFVLHRMRAILGEEPAKLVCGGLYRFSRNPMYVAMLLVIFGQAIVFGSRAVALYGAGALVFFHVSVLRIEEPHLRAKQGAAWDDYARRVPRWFGLPK